MAKPHKILITGAGGQLAHCLAAVNKKFTHEIVPVDRKTLDICNANQVANLLEKHQPDFIINTAAYTNVDRAETEQEKAYSVNAEGVKILAEVCKEFHVGLIHISTDYVFSGAQHSAYLEDDKTGPNTVYGASKLEGEKILEASGLKTYYIIRTSWLYSDYGHNFYNTMLRLTEERDTLTVVNDQVGCPTNAYNLAEVLLRIPNLSTHTSGTYHFCNRESCTWYDFARAIMKYNNKKVTVNPVSSAAFPTVAKRPAYSVMNPGKIEDLLDIEINPWKTALEQLVKRNS